MRKIKKFSVNENAFVLSPEEMRMISGGNRSNPCRVGGCYVYLIANPSIRYYGTCIEYGDGCYCQLSDGRKVTADQENNKCYS